MISIHDVIRQISEDSSKSKKVAASFYLTDSNYRWLNSFTFLYPKANASKLIDGILTAIRIEIKKQSDFDEEMFQG